MLWEVEIMSLLTIIPFAIGAIYMPLGEHLRYEPMTITGVIAMAIAVATVI